VFPKYSSFVPLVVSTTFSNIILSSFSSMIFLYSFSVGIASSILSPFRFFTVGSFISKTTEAIPLLKPRVGL